jgi:hypothetical protein
MKFRSAQHATPRLPARAFYAVLVACACVLICAGPASAAPTVTIGGFPSLRETSGSFSFDADGPVQRFQCKLDNGPIDDCTSPITLSGLSVSTHTFSVRAIGVDNSIGVPASYIWTIDITRPAIPALIAPADNLLTNNPTPTFSGTAEPFAHVSIFDGSTQIANPQAGAGGAWSFTPTDALEDGTHLWRARAIDAAGNRSDYTALRTLKIDTQSPVDPVVLHPVAAAKLTTRTPQISGTGEAQSTITVSDGATPICTAVVDPAGNWSCVSSVQLIDGLHTLNVLARDGAGNESGTVQRSFELDATPPPAPTLDTPLNNSATTATSITVRGTATPLSLLKVLIGPNEIATETAGPDGNWSHTFSSLAEGNYAFSAKEVDDFGNRSPASNVANVRVDRTPPSVTISSTLQSPTNQTSAEFTLTPSEPNVEFECALDGGGWQPCNDSPEFTGLSASTHNFKAHATDRAGNVGEDSAVFTWTIDLTPPAAPMIDNPVDGATVTNPRPPVSGHAENGSAVELFAGASSLGTAPANSNTGVWTLTPGSALAQGSVQLKARAIDAAGNLSAFSSTTQIVVDSVAPTTTIVGAPTAPIRSSTVTVSFSANDPQATFACSLDTAAFAACVSPYTTPALSEGAHTLRVRAKDVAGNTESPAKSIAITVDRTAPVGQVTLIAGSAGSDGVPKFQIASNDSTATAQCKLDNGAFATCSGQFKPAASAGIHALTIRFTDPAGNASDQVLAFSVTPVPPTVDPPPDYYQQPKPAEVCKVLGATGLTSGKLKIVAATSAGRELKLTLSSGAAALVRVDALAGTKSLLSAPYAIKAGTTKLTIRLKSAPAAGTKVALAVRFYSVKREFGTARLALTVKGAGLRPAAGAQSTLDVACPAVGGDSAGAKLVVTEAAIGARSFTINSKGKRPALVAIKVLQSGGSVPIANTLFAVGAGKQKVTIKLLSGAKFARGGYKFSFDAIGPGGKPSSGRGAFVAR